MTYQISSSDKDTLEARIKAADALIGADYKSDAQLILSSLTPQPAGEDLAHVISVILPMAKGYAAKNDVGDNKGKIQWAEQALATHRKEKQNG